MRGSQAEKSAAREAESDWGVTVRRDRPSAEDTAFFREHGYLYVKDFYDAETEVRPIQETVYRLIGLLAEDHGITLDRPPFSPEHFDAGLSVLLRENRALVGVLYDACKKIPAYIRLACHPAHEAYMAALLGSDMPGFACRGYGIRMDNPGEEYYLTQLHQDYVSQLCSQAGVVFWSPLRVTGPALGQVRIYPGSHRNGVFPIRKTAHNSRGLEIDGEAEIRARYGPITPEVAVGDCVIIHFLTLHESQPNRSEATRWAMISRYFDFLEEGGRKIGWKGGIAEGHYFDAIHPEYTTQPENDV